MDLTPTPHNAAPLSSPEHPGARPAVTVVVLNWCDEALTRECLRSVVESSYESLEVLLVDNGSDDGSGERLRTEFSGVSFLQTGSNQGYTGGNNRGIEWAMEREADYVLILNNDTVIDTACVSELVAAATDEADGPVGGVVPKILYHDDPSRIWYAGGHFSSLKGLGTHWRADDADEGDDPAQEDGFDVTFMTGCCCLLSAEALHHLGGFDEEFFAYVEDAELSLRMAGHGLRMVYRPSARVLHHSPPPGSEPSPFQIRQRDLNRRLVMRMHFSMWRRFPFLARFYATRAAHLIRYVALGDLARARAILGGALGSTSAPRNSPNTPDP